MGILDHATSNAVGSASRADFGVFGGSGFYSLFDDVDMVKIDTPYGDPSAPVAVGVLGAWRVAFIPRHGLDHEYLPHQIPAKANLWAMHALGVGRIIGPCAAGSLTPGVRPGDFVALDQFVDHTRGRPDTFYDEGHAHHVSAADPYCPEMRSRALDAARSCNITMHASGTVAVIPGPRFATRAESRAHRVAGCDVINMTQYPEAYLARELGICYCGIALVTDYDAGVENDPSAVPVTQEQVYECFEHNLQRVRQLIGDLVASLGATRSCGCASAIGPLPR